MPSEFTLQCIDELRESGVSSEDVAAVVNELENGRDAKIALRNGRMWSSRNVRPRIKPAALPKRELLLPVDVQLDWWFTENREKQEVWNVVGANLAVWCKCKDEETARYIACAINQMPRAPMDGRA